MTDLDPQAYYDEFADGEWERVLGLETIAHRMNEELAAAADAAVADVREVVELLREDRAAADVSEHILAVCRA